MKNTFLFILFCFAAMLSKTGYAIEVNAPSNICILLEQNVSGVLLEAKGPYYITNPHDGSHITSGLISKRVIVRPSSDGIRWGEIFPDYHQIRITPKNADAKLLVNGIQYDGSIIVYKIDNQLQIINELSIEDYLKSILSHQFPYPLEQEVMSSVAIAARTTAYFLVQKNKKAFWHVLASEIGYQGSAIVVPNSVVSQAVDATRHLILVQAKIGANMPFFASWTEHCAGKTASYNSIYRKDIISPKGIEVPIAALDRKDSRWTYSIDNSRLAKKMGLASIQGIDLYQDQESKKTYALKLRDDKASKDINFFAFQQYLGKENILSNDFQVELKKDQIIFTGYGKGAGVGICLHSAAAMAQNGALAVKILSSFFPDTYLINLTALPEKEIAAK